MMQCMRYARGVVWSTLETSRWEEASCFLVKGTIGSQAIDVGASSLLRCQFSSDTLQDVIKTDQMKICIVGSGPAGFYVADKVSKRLPGSSIDILESLPCPYGLVRSGVAPDHPDTKNVIHHFDDMMQRGVVEYYGNIHVGDPSAVSLAELRQMYHAVVLAYGAGRGKRLRIPGNSLRNVMSARDFVHWYNGHPGGNDVDISLELVTDVVICGLGNVALDCARLLLKDPIKDLHPTDIATHAVEALQRSKIENVHIVSRRGPAQAACTPKELRELLSLPDVDLSIHPHDCLSLSNTCEQEIKNSRIHRRVVEVLKKRNEGKGMQKPCLKHLHIHFLSSPVAYDGTEGHITSTLMQKMKLELDEDSGQQKAVAREEQYSVDSQLVIESVGYHGEPVEGAPFDDRTGTIPNILGRVLEDDSNINTTSADLYVCGWLKRGPSGIIGTNMIDAEQTVDTMVRHVSQWGSAAIPQEPKTGRQGLLELLSRRQRPVVSFKEWKNIDAEEVDRGAKVGKQREKVTNVNDMLNIAMHNS